MHTLVWLLTLFGACTRVRADFKRYITRPPPRCHFLIYNQKQWYETGRCTVIDLGHKPWLSPGHRCYSITNCPKACTDKHNITRPIGSKWREGFNSCQCNYPQRLYSTSAYSLPPSYPEWPPVYKCTFDGCQASVDGKVIKVPLGRSFTDDRGHDCQCVEGDSSVTDDAPDYNIKCSAEKKKSRHNHLLVQILMTKTKPEPEFDKRKKLRGSDGD